jgi:hypothetical protein
MSPFSHLLLSLHLNTSEGRSADRLPLEKEGVVRYEDVELREDFRREKASSCSHTYTWTRLASLRKK